MKAHASGPSALVGCDVRGSACCGSSTKESRANRSEKDRKCHRLQLRLHQPRLESGDTTFDHPINALGACITDVTIHQLLL